MENFYEWGNNQEAVGILASDFNDIESFDIINIFKISDEKLKNEVSTYMNSFDINRLNTDAFAGIYIKTSVAMLRLIHKEESIESLIRTLSNSNSTFFRGLIEVYEEDLEDINKKLLFWEKMLVDFLPILKNDENIFNHLYDLVYKIPQWAHNKISAGSDCQYSYNDLWNLNILIDSYIDDALAYIEVEEFELLESFVITEDDKKDAETVLSEGNTALLNGALLVRVYIYLRAAMSYSEVVEEYREVLFYQKHMKTLKECLSKNNETLSEAFSFCDSVLAWAGFIDITNEIMKKHGEEDLIKIELIKAYIEDLLEEYKTV